MSEAVLISGGLGYVGGRIAQRLAEASDHSLLLGTRQQVAKPAWLKRGSVVALDVLHGENLEALCQGVRAVVHLAAMNEVESLKDPALALSVNTLGTLKLLQAAERAGVERFIYFSTAHVYGAPLTGTISETMVPRPVHPYAITHRAAEDFVLAANARKVMAGVVVRLSNSFGAPISPAVNRWTLLVNDLCRQAVTTRKLVLLSAGLQKRDWITLFDTAQAVLHLLNLNRALLGDGLFNLGGENVTSVFEMATLVAARCQAVLGFSPLIIRPEPPAAEPELPLEYRIDKLTRTGFALTGDARSEIDATLRLCDDAFGTKR